MERQALFTRYDGQLDKPMFGRKMGVVMTAGISGLLFILSLPFVNWIRLVNISTMFSMIYRKPLALILHYSGKLSATVKQYGLEKFILKDTVNEDILKKDYDIAWNSIENTLDIYREYSRQYIIKSIELD